jgi:hypothetical protein
VQDDDSGINVKKKKSIHFGRKTIWRKTILAEKLFWLENYLAEHYFGRKTIWCENYLAENYFGRKTILAEKLFGWKTIS